MTTQDRVMEVVWQRQIAPDIYEIAFSGNYKDYIPGQFVQIEISKTLEPFLRRPLSICDADENTLKIVYRVLGKGTMLLSQKKTGDSLRIFGPLGNGFSYSNIKRPALVGGGMGAAPLLGLARKLYEEGTKVDVFLGFSTETGAILIDEFKRYGNVQVATIDGSYGKKGLVTDLIEDKRATFFACGPEPLYYSLEKQQVQGYYSLERRMACGVGVCLGCNITVTGNGQTSRKRVCHDGPVFPIGSVNWGEA